MFFYLFLFVSYSCDQNFVIEELQSELLEQYPEKMKELAEISQKMKVYHAKVIKLKVVKAID